MESGPFKMEVVSFKLNNIRKQSQERGNSFYMISIVKQVNSQVEQPSNNTSEVAIEDLSYSVYSVCL